MIKRGMVRSLVVLASTLGLVGGGAVVASAATQPCSFDYVSQDITYEVCIEIGGGVNPQMTDVRGVYDGIPAYPRLTLYIDGVPGNAGSGKDGSSNSDWEYDFGGHYNGGRARVCLTEVVFVDNLCSPTVTI